MSDPPIRDIHPSAYARVNAMLHRRPGQMVNDDFVPREAPQEPPASPKSTMPTSVWPERRTP